MLVYYEWYKLIFSSDRSPLRHGALLYVKICKATDTEESHMSERNHVPWTLIFSLGLVLKVRVWKTKVR